MAGGSEGSFRALPCRHAGVGAVLDAVLFGYLPVREALWGLTVSVPVQAYGMWWVYRLLDVRYKRTYIICEALLILSVVPLHGIASGWASGVMQLMQAVVVPLATSRGGKVYRAAVCAVAVLIACLTEAALANVWVIATGTAYSFEPLAAAWPFSILCAPVTMFMTAILFMVFRELVFSRRELWGLEGAAHEGMGRGVFVVCAFVLIYAVLNCMFFVTVKDSVLPEAVVSDGLIFSLLLITLVGVAMAIVALVSYNRDLMERRRAEARIEALEGRVSSALRAYEDVVDSIENAARFRHDMRNQIQVFSAVAEQEGVERAREQLVDLAASVSAAAEEARCIEVGHGEAAGLDDCLPDRLTVTSRVARNGDVT